MLSNGSEGVTLLERLALCVRKEDGKVGDEVGILWEYGKSDITYI